MLTRSLCALMLTLFLLAGCSRDPEVLKRKYVESGDKYFSKKNYKHASIMYRKALAKDAKFGEAYYKLGLSDLEAGSYNTAARALRRAIELQPNNEDAYAKLGDLYLAAYLADQRRPDNILKEIRELADEKTGLLKRSPNSYDGLRMMGYVALAEKDLKTAISYFERANAAKPMQKDVVLALAQALTADNRWPEAEKMSLELVAKNPAFGSMYDFLYIAYMRQNRQADAEAILKKKADSNPKTALYQLEMAAFYYATKRSGEMEAVLNRLIANKADFPDAHSQVGDFYLRVRNFDKADQYYQQGLSTATDTKKKIDFQKKMALLRNVQGKKKEALDLVEAVLKTDPKEPGALAMRASMSLQSGNKEQIQAAVNDLQSVMTQQPKNFVVRYELGRALMAKNDSEQARLQFQEAIKLRPDYIQPRLALARIHLQKQDWGKALQNTAEVLERNPNNGIAKILRTAALLGSGDLKQARSELETTIQEQPKLPDAQYQLAMLNFAERRYKEAEDLFKRLNANVPEDPRGIIGVVESHMAQGRQEQALAMMAEQLKKSDRPEFRLALANLAVRANKLDMAQAEYQKLLDANPNSADLHMRLGEVHRRRGDTAGAISSMTKARELAPNDHRPSVQLALMLDNDGQKDKARPVYEHVLQIDPDNPIAMNNLAYMMAEKGVDLDQALTYAQKAKQKLPNNPDVADTLGWIYIKKNLSDSAISIFRDLTSKYPNFSTYHYHLGMALYQKGDKPQAKKALENALKAKPSKDEEGRIRELIAKLG